MEGAIYLFLGFLVTQCSGNTFRKEGSNFRKPDPSLHDDIRLTPEQKIQMKERGFYTPGKWPLVDNLVTVRYYFDNVTIPADSVIRTNFKKAISVYEAQTCIRWVEVSSTDKRHKVKVFRETGCWSYVGMVQGKDNELSLGQGCEQIGTILHEMGHCMGLFHTQSRADRDAYVRVWLQNVDAGMEHNFEKSESDLFDIPYDYKSMMHYGSDYFSANGSYTLTTIDPYAMAAIGGRPQTFRYSDAAFLNRAYTCDKINEAKCPSTTCMNGGYVTQDCTCRCPENTVGGRCNTVTGPFFSDVPNCGGTVTTEREVTSFVNGVSTADRCTFKIEAPNCKLPVITFTHAKFYWVDCCYANQLTAEISRTYFGVTFCKEANVPIGKPLVSDSQRAALYSFTYITGSKIHGFKANITFIRDPACDAPQTTTKTTTTTPTTTRTTTTATTTPEPPSYCISTELGTNSFKYTTPGYPMTVDPNSKCKYDRKPAQNTDIIFTKAQISLKFGAQDRIMFQDTYLPTGFTGTQRDLVIYHLWPIKMSYTAGATPGQGFSVTHTPVTGLPTPCNGETFNMTTRESRFIKNPLVGYPEKSVSCAFKIVAPTGKRLTIIGIKMGLTSTEYFAAKAYLPTNDFFQTVSTNPFSTVSNTVILYYIGSSTYTPWEIKVSVV